MTAEELFSLLVMAPWPHLMVALADTFDTIAAQRGGGEGQSGWI